MDLYSLRWEPTKMGRYPETDKRAYASIWGHAAAGRGGR